MNLNTQNMTNKKTKVQVFILTHNRPLLLLKTIKSIMNQDYMDFSFIISDNSSNEDTKEILFPLNLNCIYIRRFPMLSSIEHFNTVLSEVTSEYFMMFHDDDIMNIEMISKLVDCLDNNINCVAACTNADNMDEGGNLIGHFSSLHKDQIIYRKEELYRFYYKNKSLPFPSFMYRTSMVKGIFLDLLKGGKYCDSCFILDLLDKGPIFYIYSYIGMCYRRSKFQDSHFIDLKARSKQIRYFSKAIDIDFKSEQAVKWRLKELYITCCVEKKRFNIQLLHLFKKNGMYNLWIKALIKNIFLNVSR